MTSCRRYSLSFHEYPLYMPAGVVFTLDVRACTHSLTGIWPDGSVLSGIYW